MPNASNILEEVEVLLLNHHLKHALERLSTLFDGHPSLVGYDEYQSLGKSYDLMLHYMREGISDPQRTDMFLRLMQDAWRITANITIAYRCKNEPLYITEFRRSDHLNMSYDFLRSVLEEYVTSSTLLTLQPEAEQEQQGSMLAERHVTFLYRLFAQIFVSLQWTDADREFFSSLVLSPTIDQRDQQLIVSAISMALWHLFDSRKMLALIDIYRKTENEESRQRALVGWALTLNAMPDFFPDVDDAIRQIWTDENVRADIEQLQKQVFLCMKADEDYRTIQNEYMPGITNSMAMRFKDGKFVEEEEDPLRDILHPEAEDDAISKSEENIRKIWDMQKQGSDINFGGFSHMKSFTFFSEIANWFMPFRYDHPGLHYMQGNISEYKHFLDAIVNHGMLCQSDRYSFILGMMSVLNRMPENVRSMIKQQDIPLANIDEHAGSSKKPYVVRRLYMQDIYRYFRLCHQRSSKFSPFTIDDNMQGLFLASNIMVNVNAQDSSIPTSIAHMLYSNKVYAALEKLMDSYDQQVGNTTDFKLLKGYTYMRTGDNSRAYDMFSTILKDDPLNTTAMIGLAQAATAIGDYDTAYKAYSQLLMLGSEKKSYKVNFCISAIESGHHEEARQTLAELFYKYPDDTRVHRLMGWNALATADLENAQRHYSYLLDHEPKAEDYLNAGYLSWIKADIKAAIRLFHQYLTEGSLTVDNIRDDFQRDKTVLEKNGISELDRHLMADALEPHP
jgi:Flp pilus assembly protein TadD